MTQKSLKNHLNLMLPSQEAKTDMEFRGKTICNLNHEDNSKIENLELNQLDIPSIIQDNIPKSDLVENDIQLNESYLINNVYLAPNSVSSSLYLNRVLNECVNRDFNSSEIKLQNIQEISLRQQQILLNFQKLKKKIGDVLSDDIITLEELGKGNGGVVTKVKHKPSCQIMARKNIHLEIKPAIRTQIMRELQVLHDCNSPYIVGYYGSYHVETEISICMEYMNGGSLDLILKKAGRFPEPIVAHITCSVLRGLIYLRKALHIIHRDVKPSNILVNMEGDVKLCDFGVSGRLIDSMANSFVGTRSYMAPERLTGEQYNTLSDVWSLGLSLAELATGIYPIPPVSPEKFLSAFSIHKSENFIDHLRATENGTKLQAIQTSEKGSMAIFELLSYIVDYPPPTLPEFCFSSNFLSFINYCLKKEPNDRLSLEMLEKHKFIAADSIAILISEINKDYVFSKSSEILVGRYIQKIMLL
uniref:mitogen-activated protein kinase kinase n=1 Tax=Dugesia japonica TaxID=6161 RepID=A0A193PD23_DUGJA|nr:MAPK/ERK kinase 1/2 [Dugesia japonica]